MISNSRFLQTEGMAEWLTTVPYDVTRRTLYNAADLYEGYEPSENAEDDRASFAQCYDSRVYPLRRI